MEAIDGGHWRAGQGRAERLCRAQGPSFRPSRGMSAVCGREGVRTPSPVWPRRPAPGPDASPLTFRPRRRPAPHRAILRRSPQAPWSLRQAGRQPDASCAPGRRRALAHKSTLPSISAMPEPADSGRQGRRGFPRPRGERPALPAQLKIYRCVENTLPTKRAKNFKKLFSAGHGKPEERAGFCGPFRHMRRKSSFVHGEAGPGRPWQLFRRSLKRDGFWHGAPAPLPVWHAFRFGGGKRRNARPLSAGRQAAMARGQGCGSKGETA